MIEMPFPRAATMPDIVSSMVAPPSSRSRWTTALIGVLFHALLASNAGAAPSDIVRDLAAHIGPIVGSALACQDIARPRI